MSDDKRNLFRLLEVGDRRISQAYKRAIILVGTYKGRQINHLQLDP